MKFEYNGRRKIDYTAFIATALAGAIVAQKDTVSASFFSDRIRESIPATGSDDIIAKISNYMEKSEFKDKTSIGKMISLLSEKIGRRKCVFIISDFFNDTASIFDGIKRLIFNNNEVILFHVLDPLEMDFDYKGQVELIELEGENRLFVRGNGIRDKYNELFGQYLKTMKKETQKLGIDYVLCDTSQNFGITLSKYLNTRVTRGAG